MATGMVIDKPLFEEYPLTRRDAAGMIVLTCEKMPGLFLSATGEDEVRDVIDEGLKMALNGRGKTLHVYTNGSIAGPVIGTVVKITD